MKIEPKDIQSVAAATQPTKTPHGGTSDFKEVLQDAQSKTSLGKTDMLSLPASAVIPMIALDTTTQVGQSSDRAIVAEVENLLNVMADYQNQMENPSVSLKQIQPLVEKMDTETEKLLPVLDTLPDSSSLKDILNRVLVASSVEVIKFNRGDYL